MFRQLKRREEEWEREKQELVDHSRRVLINIPKQNGHTSSNRFGYSPSASPSHSHHRSINKNDPWSDEEVRDMIQDLTIEYDTKLQLELSKYRIRYDYDKSFWISSYLADI